MLPRDEGSAAAAVSPLGCGPQSDNACFLPDEASQPQASTVTTSPDIQVLTRAVRRGDAEAFSQLYDLYSFRLYKYLLVLTHGDENEAREVCQSVLLKLAKRCDAFSDERRLWAWLCVLARNTFLDHWRAQRRLDRFVSLDELPPAELNRQLNPEHRLCELLGEALAALAPDERELIQAAYVDARPLRELADEAGQTYKAVESRLGRLRQKLKTQLLRDLRHENEC
jgi:RNA polymerase sigma-70 factor, ECF subfamily